VFDYGEEVAEVPVRPRGMWTACTPRAGRCSTGSWWTPRSRPARRVRHRVAARDLWLEGGRVAGVVLDDGRTRTRVRAGLVVGADGIRSGVALRVGAEVRYAARASSATVYTYATGLPAGAYRNYSGRAGTPSRWRWRGTPGSGGG
jgi:2-polyprenyl-6-methoxyphenol hydroxylase-like FAD-dependent oxidoreductase